MCKILPVALLLLGNPSAFAQAEKPKPAYDFSLSREDKIKLAESAASGFLGACLPREAGQACLRRTPSRLMPAQRLLNLLLVLSGLRQNSLLV